MGSFDVDLVRTKSLEFECMNQISCQTKFTEETNPSKSMRNKISIIQVIFILIIIHLTRKHDETEQNIWTD